MSFSNLNWNQVFDSNDSHADTRVYDEFLSPFLTPADIRVTIYFDIVFIYIRVTLTHVFLFYVDHAYFVTICF